MSMNPYERIVIDVLNKFNRAHTLAKALSIASDWSFRGSFEGESDNARITLTQCLHNQPEHRLYSMISTFKHEAERNINFGAVKITAIMCKPPVPEDEVTVIGLNGE